MNKFGSISGYGDIYPAVAFAGGDSITGWYSTATRRCYYQNRFKECSTTNYRIIKNWSRSSKRSGNSHARADCGGEMHACVISTSAGEIVGGYVLDHDNAHGCWGSNMYVIKGEKNVTFINGE